MNVRVHAPEPHERSWQCRYEIDWPGKPRAFAAYGNDGVQALTLAMNMIAIELYTSSYHAAGTLMLEEPGTGYGFPIGKSNRDLLIGDDAKFDGN